MTRLRCKVPFCRRTRGKRKGEPPIRGGEQWICGEHWRLVDREAKRMNTACIRRWRRVRSDKHLNACHRAWERCKRQAIERAAGITA